MSEGINVGSITDPLFSEQWNLIQLNILPAWSYTLGEGSVVGIIDSGVDAGHIDLGWDGPMLYMTASDGTVARKAKYNVVLDEIRSHRHSKVLPGWNFIEHNDDTWDLYRHGTYIAGTIAADLDGQGMVGVAPECKIRPYVVVNDKGYTTQNLLAEAILKAEEDDCDVINISLAWPNITTNLSKVLDSLKDTTIVISATGNNNINSVYYPGRHDRCITAGGSDPSGKRWIHSKDIGSNYGYNTICLMPGSSQKAVWFMRWRWTDAEGTSQSAANLSGVVALMKSVKKDITDREVRSYLSHFGSNREWNEMEGYGIIDVGSMITKLYDDCNVEEEWSLKDSLDSISKKLDTILERLT